MQTGPARRRAIPYRGGLSRRERPLVIVGSAAIKARRLLCPALTLFGLLQTAHAQAPPALPRDTPGILLEQQRRSEEQKKLQEEFTQPAPPSPVERPTRPHAPTEGGPKVRVNTIVFSGNTVILTEELEKVVAPALGKELTLGELNQVAEKVSQYYVKKGYILAQAYLPPQEVREGVIEIAILEGEVGAIEVHGNQRYASSTILGMLEPIHKRRVLHEGVLETALNELNEYPGLTVRATLKPGANLGQTDLDVTAQERMPYTLALNLDNYGSRLTGPWRYGTDIGIGNLLGVGDNLMFTGMKSNTRLFFTNVGYAIPVNHFGTKVQANWSHSENVVGQEFGFSRPVGRADIISGDVLQTISRTSLLTLVANGGFDYKTVRNIVSGSLASKDELRIFRLGLRGDYRDLFLGRTFFGATWHYGVDVLGGSAQDAPMTSFSGAGPGKWSTATGDLARFQSLAFPWVQGLPLVGPALSDSSLLLRATGQIASDRLLSPERFSIGGYYTVRGYPVAEKIGDDGYAVTAELTVPIPSSAKIPFSETLVWKQTVQLAAFIDHGATFVSPVTFPPGQRPPLPQEYLTGAGGGLRINLPFGVPHPVDRGLLAIKIDWASAIGRPRPSSRDEGIKWHSIAGDGAAGILYISAALQF